MGDIQTRPFSKNYSGLVNQSVIAIAITVVCVTGQELMKRARRGYKYNPETLGSRESWEFGYLYQGRSWARYPSPPSPGGWPLSWVKQVVFFPADKMNELRGVDATLYIRWLRGCFFFVLLHTFTTFPILFPIHVEFSEDSISKKSMTRASITSLVASPHGLSLLWIHICLLFWITLSWMGVLLWICHGAFQLRADKIAIAAKRMAEYDPADPTVYPHPHPQYGFADVPTADRHHPNFGLRLRTVMVSNVPVPLRDEKTLKDYFEYYLSRELEKPSLGLTSSTQPGFINKSVAFLFNRAKRLPVIPIPLTAAARAQGSTDAKDEAGGPTEGPGNVPVIERVVVARKMTELSSLLERREDILRMLETAHIKLAKKTVLAVQHAIARKDANKPVVRPNSKPKRRVLDAERATSDEGTMSEEERMQQLIEVIGPYVEEFGLRPNTARNHTLFSKHEFRKLRAEGSQDSDSDHGAYPPTSPVKATQGRTIYEALLSLPRSSLDAYQPLINLSHVFRGKTVPSIDYYTAKFNLLTSFITENRAKSVTDYDPVSTAFVTFADPADARRACKYLAVHPNNPLTCLVTMAPEYQDLDWIRVMKSSYNGEFVKDWVVNMGVWTFTVFWLFPVSLLVGLVSIQNISVFLPALKVYLDKHQWEEDLIQSFLPTLLVSLLALSIPPILLLIAKKAHTITTLSALHDLIMTRYYKFLIVNVLVFFCVGTAALQSVLDSFKANQTSKVDILSIVASSFPTAGPFYVGWLIFTVGMHGGFEIALLGLPLIVYPTTRRQVTPRKRAVGTRPRTFNFYYWLPTHLLVVHVMMLFMILNPIVIPFGAFYFFIEAGVVKNQLIHVYAKNYEGNGQVILIRIARYSLDGLILSQTVFMAYMIVLKKTVNFALAAVLIIFTTAVKLLVTRMIRTQFEHDDILEAQILVPRSSDAEQGNEPLTHDQDPVEPEARNSPHAAKDPMFSFRLPAWVNLSYATVRPHRPVHYRPNPFGPRESFARLGSMHFEAPNQASPTEAQRLIRRPPMPNNGRLPGGSKSEDGPQLPNDVLGPAVPHPPPPIWDDDNTADLPYDNPFYTRTIDNVLWLPRDPFGKLDLDDTIDLKIAVTVDPTGGRLGQWLSMPETASPMQMSEASIESPPPDERPSAESSLEQGFDGSEDIELPLVIAKRAQANDDVETVRRRRSTFRRKNSISTIASRPRRPSAKISTRSFSDGSMRPRERERSTSMMSTLQPPTMDRVRSADRDIGARPDAHAQAEFVLAHSSGSHLSVARPPLRKQRSHNVSAHAAITHEVLAEEQVALEDRLEEEEREAEKATKPRSWFTAWMFKKEPPAEGS